MKAGDIDLHKAKDWSVFDVLKFIAECDFLESLPILSLSLPLLSIESDIVKDIDFDSVIDKFAALKTRKGNF